MSSSLPSKPPESNPAARPVRETRAPGFLAGVAGNQVTAARFGPVDKTQKPGDERARGGVVDLREVPRPGGGHLHALHPAPQSPSPTPPAEHEHRGHPPLVDPGVERERDRLVHAVETLQLQAQRLGEQARSDALEIAFQIAQKIVETELRQSPEPLFALVRSALRQAGEARKLKLRLHPADAELVRSTKGTEATAGMSIAKIEIAADATLQRGDVMVDTDFGSVDGRLATRFGELRRALAVTDAA